MNATAQLLLCTAVSVSNCLLDSMRFLNKLILFLCGCLPYVALRMLGVGVLLVFFALAFIVNSA